MNKRDELREFLYNQILQYRRLKIEEEQGTFFTADPFKPEYIEFHLAIEYFARVFSSQVLNLRWLKDVEDEFIKILLHNIVSLDDELDRLAVTRNFYHRLFMLRALDKHLVVIMEDIINHYKFKDLDRKELPLKVRFVPLRHLPITQSDKELDKRAKLMITTLKDEMKLRPFYYEINIEKAKKGYLSDKILRRFGIARD